MVLFPRCCFGCCCFLPSSGKVAVFTILAYYLPQLVSFISLNAVEVSHGTVIVGPAYDAGSEENTEACPTVAGSPNCPTVGAAERATENAEGFVHIHRGHRNDADIPIGVNWRNPIVQYEFV